MSKTIILCAVAIGALVGCEGPEQIAQVQTASAVSVREHWVKNDSQGSEIPVAASAAANRAAEFP